MKKIIRCIFIFIIILGTSCGDNMINETSLFEGKQIGISYNLDIVDPFSECRCIDYNDDVITIFIEGKEFIFAQQDLNVSIGSTEAIFVRGEYKDVREFVIAIGNGDDLIKFINKVHITIIITRSCIEEIQRGNYKERRPIKRI